MINGGGPARAVRPRVLIPITINFSIRYVVRTGLIDRLRTICEPVLGLTWDDPGIVAALTAEGIEVVILPIESPSRPVRLGIATAQNALNRRLASPSASIERRRRSIEVPAPMRFRRWLAWHRARFQVRQSDALERATTEVGRAVRAEPGLGATVSLLQGERIDGLLTLTPYVVQELLVLEAAASLGLPRCTSILSFDNLTTRPPLPVTFDRYLVWNAFNAAELIRSYPGVDADRVAVTGPPQFDFHLDRRWVADEACWRARLGLAAGERTILFGAGPPSIAPHEDQYLDDLLAAVDDGRLPGDLRIVLRRHPADRPDRWERFERRREVVFDDPGPIGRDAVRPGQADLRDEQITDLCSSLAHTDVHVSTSSTMTLDGAWYDKPQLGPAYDRVRGGRHHRRARDLYRRQHFMPIVASGGLELATSPDQLVKLVGLGLADPGRRSAERRAMLEALCTFTDGRCTERVADEVHAWVKAAFPKPGQSD